MGRRGTKRILIGTLLVVFLALAGAAAFVAPKPAENSVCSTWERSGGNRGEGAAPLENSDAAADYAALKRELAADRDVQLDQTFISGDAIGSYHLFQRDVDFDDPTGIVVRLHGDGGWEFDHPALLPNCLAAVAAEHNMVTLFPQAPETPTEPAGETWWHDLPANYEWVTALVNRTLAQNPSIDPNNIVWMGYSGGAEFISYSLLTEPTDLVNRGTILVAGGGAPRRSNFSGPLPDTMKEARHSWHVGTLDNGDDPENPFDALTAARKGQNLYSRIGFTNTGLTLIDDQAHLDMPHLSILDDELTVTGTRMGAIF